MDLNKMVMNSMAKMESEGKVQEIVYAKIEATVSNIVDEAFGRWSKFSKNLQKEVEEQIQINLQELDLPSYNHLVLSAIKEKLDDQFAAEGVARINESLDTLLAAAKPEYKLSELVKEMSEEVDTEDMDYEEYHEMTMHIDDSFSLAYIIAIDPESDKSEYDCKYRFWVSKETGKIKNIAIEDNRRGIKREVNEFDARAIMRGMRGLEETLFKMYARGSKLIIDEDYVELEISNPEYD
jgi:hypothetical protein